MNEHEAKLSELKNRMKNFSHKTPIQEIKPVKIREEKTIRSTVYLPEDLHEKVKIHCIKNRISLKEFITELIEEKFTKNGEK